MLKLITNIKFPNNYNLKLKNNEMEDGKCLKFKKIKINIKHF